MPEKVDAVCDLGVTKPRATAATGCDNKKQETKKLVKIAVLLNIFA
jgi:hypothetical protein